MILAAGMSPAWQLIMEFESLQLGEVNRARTSQGCASGKVINVAIAAKHLGAKTALLSCIGGSTGDAIAEEIKAFDIFSDWIRLPVPTRTCTTILEDSKVTTELVENAGPVEAAILEQFYQKFRIHAEVADITVLTGSIPENAPQNYYAALIRDVPTRFILDFRGEGLLNALPLNPFLVKPNREELATTVGLPLQSDTDVLEAMRVLNRRGAEWVVVSDGPRTVFVTSREACYRLTPPTINVINPIGSGDCLAAGIAVKLDSGAEVIDAVKFGIAAAATNAEMLLPGRLKIETCESLAEQVHVTD